MSRQASERGIALFVTIFALLLLSAIAFGLMYMADTETSINYNYRAAQQAFFAAQAGLQEVRERMMPANTAPHLIVGPTLAPSISNAASVIYVLNPAGASQVVNPSDASTSFFDDELCHENFVGLGLTNTGANVRCATAPTGAGWALSLLSDAPYSTTASALSYKWVRITQKVNISSSPWIVNGSNPSSPTNPNTQVCWDGVHEFLLPSTVTTCIQPDPGTTVPPPRNPVFLLTSLAVTSSGARRMAQMEVAQDPPMVTNAAVDSQDHVVLNGQLTVTGYDYCSCQCTTTKHGSTSTMTCTDRAGNVCDRTKYAIFSSSGIDNPTSSEDLFAGTSPVTAANQPWPYDIPGEIDRYHFAPGTIDTSAACYAGGPSACGYSCTGSPAACGTKPGQQFGIPPAFPPNPPSNPASDPSLGTWTNQVTYVPGNLQITGGSMGSGILVVDGDLDIHGGMQFYGLIVVRGVVSFTGGGSDKTNIFGSVLAGQESRVDTVLGGSAVISFDYCALPQGNRNRPPSVLAFREVMY